jgi:hypothetical protein
MVLADTIAIFLTILGVLICFNAIWLFVEAIWGSLVGHAREAHYDGMVKSFFLGLPLTAVATIAFGALVNEKQGPWGLVGLLLAGLYILFASIGVSAMASLIGEKLGGTLATQPPQPPWRVTLGGGIVLVLTFLFPILGWLLILPVAYTVGLGATMRALVRERKSQSGAKQRGTAGFADAVLSKAKGGEDGTVCPPSDSTGAP